MAKQKKNTSVVKKAPPKSKTTVIKQRKKLEKASEKAVENLRTSPVASDLTKEEFNTLSAIAVRATIASRLGKQFGDDRDLYAALGYKKQITYDDFAAKYQRQDIARTIIDLPVKECWRMPPKITESDDKPTKFEEGWQEIVENIRVFHYLSRVDRLSSIGNYAALLIGFADGSDLTSEVNNGKELLYLMPYSQNNVSIEEYETDTTSPRYGKPLIYKVTQKSTSKAGQGVKGNVHWSRIIHVAEDCLEDDTEGIPRLRAIYNRLDDLERLAGGSSEMFWRGAFPGYGFKLDKGHTLGKQQLAELQDELEEYMHGLKRYIRLRGMSVEALAMQVADPTGHVALQIDLIAATVRIPKRILLGSERGQLASSQDEVNWALNIAARQTQHCEPVLLRPLIDRLIEHGVLPAPKERYGVEWDDLLAPSDKEKVEVGKLRSDTLKNYVNAPGAEDVIPPQFFYEKFLFLSDDDIAEIEEMQKQMLTEEAADADAAEQQEEDESDVQGGQQTDEGE